MKVLIIGSGGREHALAWRCRGEGHEVLAAPGSPAMAEDGVRVTGVSAADLSGVVELAMSEGVELAVVGPEQPLVEGLADRLRASGVATLGPGAAAAELEGSKAAAKAFMQRHHIPTANFVTVASLEDGRAAIGRFERPPVVKASGLAAGKGVTVAETFDESIAALEGCLADRRFGTAGATVVLEERMHGEECSYFAICDGHRAVTLAPAQDHKRIFDGDRGPNTGGMGAYAPAPICGPELEAVVLETIVQPTLDGLAAEGRPFVGVLFVGLMIDGAGRPRVVEYNVRFGDPETQALVFGLREPLVPVMHAAAEGDLARLGRSTPRLEVAPSVAVVMASGGYPGSVERGIAIEGLDAVAALPEVKVFHAGTRRDPGGAWRTDGGRVLAVCARGDGLAQATERAYAAVDGLSFEGAQVRRDIAARALA